MPGTGGTVARVRAPESFGRHVDTWANVTDRAIRRSVTGAAGKKCNAGIPTLRFRSARPFCFGPSLPAGGVALDAYLVELVSCLAALAVTLFSLFGDAISVGLLSALRRAGGAVATSPLAFEGLLADAADAVAVVRVAKWG